MSTEFSANGRTLIGIEYCIADVPVAYKGQPGAKYKTLPNAVPPVIPLNPELQERIKKVEERRAARPAVH